MKSIQADKDDDDDAAAAVYDAHATTSSSAIAPPPRLTDVRLIDFAHCHQDPTILTPDEGLLLGLTNLITYLGLILTEHEKNNAHDTTYIY